jgi:activator of HSP90 ATPase
MQPMTETVTRRQLALLLGSLGAAASTAGAQTGEFPARIHQEVDFPAKPARLYEILLDARLFAAFTKDTAEVQPRPGEPFKLFGGRVTGRNVELVADRRIVQAWRPESWPPGVYSIVRFELAAAGSGTHLAFDHTGFPEEEKEHLVAGWPRMYWDPLRKYLSA